MLPENKDVRPKKGVNKPFEKCFHVCGVFRIFFWERVPKFDIYFKRSSFGRIILKHIENKKTLGGSGGMFPRKIFENLHAAMAILVLLEQFSGAF